MAQNIERFKKDLDRLLTEGNALQLAMYASSHSTESAAKAFKVAGISPDLIKKAKSDASSLGVNYQSWYTECIALIKQTVPDRLPDFIKQYETPKGRKDIDFLSYVISDMMIGLQTSRSGEVIADSKAAIPKFQLQLAILSSVSKRFQTSLFEIRQILQADLFDEEIAASRELLKNGFLRAAGAMAGVIIESHLKQVCADHNLRIQKKHPTISDFNEALKGASVIDLPQWRHISLMADYRNLCDHSKDKEPKRDQVEDLIDGAEKILKTIS